MFLSTCISEHFVAKIATFAYWLAMYKSAFVQIYSNLMLQLEKET